MAFPKKRFFQIRFLAFFFSGLFLLFLILLFLYGSLQFKALQSALDSSDRERLKLLGESVRTALSERLNVAKEDVSFLHSFASERKIKQIVWVDSDGVILGDSGRQIKKGEKILSDVTAPPWGVAFGGETAVEISLDKKSGEPLGSIWIPLRDHDGVGNGAMQIVFPLPPREDPGARSLLLFLKYFGIVGGGVSGYYSVRALFASPAVSKKEWDENTTETGFLIDTFHHLIQQLKQKEQELARLKGMAEEHAKRVESYNENILQSVTSGVLTLNREKRITTFNTAAGSILNLAPEEVLERSYESVFGMNQRLISLLEETLERGKEAVRQEYEMERADGKKIWLGLNTSVLRDRDHHVIGATLVFTDLTDMKGLQEQIELKKRLAMMGEMSAWIAHEFRNYMGTILGFARLLSKKIEPNDSRQEMLRAITNELSAMERLITELLSYGRKTMIHPTPVALVPLLQEVMAHFTDAGADPLTRWSFSFVEGFPDAPLDPLLIRQAFSNLIQNALEATPAGGEIQISLLVRPEGMIQVKISDTGPGISKEHLDKIFLPFFTTKEKGTGLGLALVHKIILAHHGQISVESGEGRGTTFTVTLPLRTSASPTKE